MDDVTSVSAPRHSALERLVAVVNARGQSESIRSALTDFAGGAESYSDDAVTAVGRAAATVEALFDVGDIDVAAAQLNDILTSTSSAPRLSNHGGVRWHLHLDTQPFDWSRWFLSASALSMAVTLSDHSRITWGRCARPGCGLVFSGLGRGSAQTYCSNRCGSRVRMAKRRAAAAH
jgi:predicted RNA-binding Zn ribbon-like protein